MKLQSKKKYKILALGILLDAIGMIPFIDILWAPLSGYIMTRLYKGQAGKYAGIFAFIEEILPGLDFIPSFTIMWLYTYVFSARTEEVTIEVEAD